MHAYSRPRPAKPGDLPFITALAREEFGDERELSPQGLADWTVNKTPALVVTDEAGARIGYARAKPNEALGISRSRGQTAVLAHIAVVPSHRGFGVGRTLHDRILKTLAMQGFSRVFAQVPAHLVDWYASLGWTAHRVGEIVAWIEPPNAQDDVLAPGAVPRTFAPILCIQYLTDYPVLVERWIGSDRPLLEWRLDGRVSPELLPQRVNASLADLLASDSLLANRLPQALCDVVIDTDTESTLARALLKLGR